MQTTTSATIPGFIDPQPDNYAWLILGCFIFPISCFYFLRTTSDGKLYDLGGLPILSVWSFFSKRYDFMRKNSEMSRGLPFRFRVLQHRVVAVTGPKGRRLFFNNSSLDVSQGYKILLGGVPRIDDVPVGGTDNAKNNFFKNLQFIQQKDRIREVLPILIDDLNRCMLDWGRDCVINPFKEVNELIFQMLLRLTTCEELCRDKEAAKMITKLYWDLEKSTTPTALLLPWFPSPSRRTIKKATRDLYNFILQFVQIRRAADTPTKDLLDVLIQRGDKDVDIVTFVMIVMSAGIISTGINSCWALLYLGNHDDWRQRAISEIQSMISAHSDDGQIGTSEPLHNRLASIPLSAWEDELPALDLIIRETIRLSTSITHLRRNLRSEVEAGGVRIAKGDFMAYLSTDIHMNEDIYKNPETFDPGRYEDGRNEDKSVYCGYIGWGAGRHPCAGMRLAKLEMKLVLSMLLVGYDYIVVDEHGNQTNKLPKPNRNDALQARPLGKPVYLKCKRIE